MSEILKEKYLEMVYYIKDTPEYFNIMVYSMILLVIFAIFNIIKPPGLHNAQIKPITTIRQKGFTLI